MSELIDPMLTVSPYISKVKVRDYAPLRAASVAFKRGLNIIIGSNGTGKTRFLSLLNELADLRENTKHYQGGGCELTFAGGFSEQTRFTVAFEEDNGTLRCWVSR